MNVQDFANKINELQTQLDLLRGALMGSSYPNNPWANMQPAMTTPTQPYMSYPQQMSGPTPYILDINKTENNYAVTITSGAGIKVENYNLVDLLRYGATHASQLDTIKRLLDSAKVGEHALNEFCRFFVLTDDCAIVSLYGYSWTIVDPFEVTPLSNHPGYKDLRKR